MTDEDFAWGDGGFVKVYGDRLADSSLMDCAVATRWAFIVMLSKADSEGRFRCATVAGLSRCAAISMAEAEQAVRELEAPDETSTSTEAEGRRIVRIPGGWQLVNYVKYRDFRTRRQIEDARRQEEYRAARRRDVSRDRGDKSQDVTVRSAPDVRRKTSDVRHQKEHMAGGQALPENAPASQPDEPEAVGLIGYEDVVRARAETSLALLAEATGQPAEQLLAEASKTSRRGQRLTRPEQLKTAPFAWVEATGDRLAARLADAREASQGRGRDSPELQRQAREAIERRAAAKAAGQSYVAPGYLEIKAQVLAEGGQRTEGA